MKGSGGKRVKALQTYLNDTAYWTTNSTTGFTGCSPKLVVDGKWGSLTDACYKRMRNNNDNNQDDYIEKSFYDTYIKKHES